MRLTTPRIDAVGEHVRLTATLGFDAPGRPPFDAVIEVPAGRAAWLDATADAFLPTAALVARALGEPLRVEGAVDPVLLAGARAIVEGAVAVDADATRPVDPVAGSRLLLFTRGIDSSWSLLALRDELDGVVYLHGLDPNWSPATHAENAARIAEAAAAAGLPTVLATTNLRDVVDPLVPFIESHHAVLGSALLALGRGVAAAHAAGGTSGRRTLWEQLTTSRTRFSLHGHPVPRSEKAGDVAADPTAARRLKCCYEGDVAGNCGRCAKCVTTLVYLLARPDADAAGVLAAFPETTPEDVREAGADLAVLLRTIPGLGQAFIDAGLPRVLRDLPRAYRPLGRAVRDLFGDALPPLPPDVAGGDDPATGLDATVHVARAFRHASRLPAAVEAGWEDGRLPLRPRAAEREACRRALADPAPRPVPWALLDAPGPAAARVAAAALGAWGAGIVRLDAGWPADDAEAAEARALLAACRVRLIPGDASGLRAGPVLAALRAGAVPLQVLDPLDAARLAPRLPAPLRAALVPLAPGGALPSFDELDLPARRRALAAHLLAGSQERDLARA